MFADPLADARSRSLMIVSDFSPLESINHASNAKTRMKKTKLVPEKNEKRHAAGVAELRKTTRTEIVAANLNLEEERIDETTAANNGSNAYGGGYRGGGCYICGEAGGRR
ncbi:hypothetical protein U1Q18_000208 [Sarracenia purpurea var. burkii]